MAVFLIIVAIIMAIITPIAGLWALNTLFPVLAIPYTIETWLAAFIALGLFKTEVSVNKK